MNPRILMVANWDWVLFNFRLPLVRELEAHGAEVILVCPPGRYVKEFRERGFRWEPWEMDRRSVSPGREFLSLWKLLSIYRKYQPVAIHHITIKPILYGSLVARLGVEAVVINNFTGLGYMFSDQPGANRIRTVLLPIFRWALKDPEYHSVLLNQHDFDRLNSLGIISSQRSTVIASDGVDLERFHPPPRGERAQGDPIVIMAARLLRDKGVMEFMEAARRLRKEGLPARFWVAGEPDPGNPTSISEEEFNRYSGYEYIKFLGRRDDLPSLLQKSSIAVLPSYHEGVPMFLLEAAATGLPLVGSDIEGCRMIIDEGENGFLVPKKDVTALADKIRTLVLDPSLRAEMGERSRSIAEERFDQKQVIGEFLNLYERLGILNNT